MIAKEMRGWRVAGLMRYLFGPERSGLKHENPRIVAAWDGDPAGLQPEKLPFVLVDGKPGAPGEFDFDLRELIDHMEAPARQNGLPVSTPPVSHRLFGKKGLVWHTPVRAHPDDPVLSDAQWREIAEEIMDRTGIAKRGDAGGCRWVAVRHDDESIHLVAMLVRQDTGKRFHPKFSRKELRSACRDIEDRLGLHVTADADKTAAARATRGEAEKALRLGNEVPARYQLREVVTQAASAVSGPEEFLAELQRQGCLVRTNTDADGVIRGYAVASSRETTSDGVSVYYSGSRLAPDLSWPQLLGRWASAPKPTAAPDGDTSYGRIQATENATRAVKEARQALRDGTEPADGISHTTADLLNAYARATEPNRDGPLSDAARAYDRAARTPGSRSPEQLGRAAQQMRQAAWILGGAGMLSGRGTERYAAAALVAALAGLLLEIAAWQAANQRAHQSAAAHTAGRHVEQAARPGFPPVGRRPGDAALAERRAQRRTVEPSEVARRLREQQRRLGDQRRPRQQ
ncbi:relaxase/mobilization nuclease domain-containing protein [Amycolatopsis sp. NPDC051903]|uniref:relaxase/mobilization nuclease domain-containing protein n=1 Tax=Amycolatopsis sp. NPDC051903 TaxID=3363936 RepID=UPI0037A55C0D